jgi:peroxiredoxin
LKKNIEIAAYFKFNQININSFMTETLRNGEFPLSVMKTNTGQSILELSMQSPIMLIFLRHFGCTFCREALDYLSQNSKEINDFGTSIVFVHMSDNATAEKYFAEFKIKNPVHISDIECQYYADFGLVKGKFSQLFGFQNWSRAFNTGVVKGYGWANQIGDGFQMPGVFVISEGEIKTSFIHKYASDQPDYIELAKCCMI